MNAPLLNAPLLTARLIHARLLPLAPDQTPANGGRWRFGMPRLTMWSMPWLELGFFAVMIVTVIRLGT